MQSTKNEIPSPNASATKQLQSLTLRLADLCTCFLLRAHDSDPDPLWHTFYNIQMTSYLIAKRNLAISNPEGDMVHDLIRDTWLQLRSTLKSSKFYKSTNPEQLFKTIQIDFPLDPFDLECTFCTKKVYLLCQNDTKNKAIG